MYRKIKLLFIEDQPEAIETILVKLKKSNYDTMTVNFADGQREMYSFEPDIIVLDILEGGLSEQRTPGINIYWEIFRKRFCPIIIHSAAPDLLEIEENDFIKKITKGSKSIDNLNAALEEFKPHILTLLDIEKLISQEVASALRDLAHYAFRSIKEPSKEKEIIYRCGRRRLAALMDEPINTDDKLNSWEKYLFPPISKDLNLGDVLKRKNKPNNPSNFVIVLTPSCDLVCNNRHVPKVETVLIAKCCSIKDGLNKTSKKGITPDKFKKHLKNILPEGIFEGMIILPEFVDQIPHMMVNLKDLVLVPFEKINKQFEIVASIDSPFREQIAWAYMQVGCRPGLPDINQKKWCDEIFSHYQKSANKSK